MSSEPVKLEQLAPQSGRTCVLIVGRKYHYVDPEKRSSWFSAPLSVVTDSEYMVSYSLILYSSIE